MNYIEVEHAEEVNNRLFTLQYFESIIFQNFVIMKVPTGFIYTAYHDDKATNSFFVPRKD